MKEGMKYDLKVQEISSYKGLQEKGREDLSEYYAPLYVMRQNEVVRSLRGVYKNRYFYVNGKKVPLYFKNRKLTPKNGSNIKID